MKLPPYNIFPNLSDDKILLRQVLSSDIQDLIEISFYDNIPAKNLEEAIKMQNKINKNYQDGDSIHWCIVNKASKNIVGTCGYYRGFANQAGELGCVLIPQYRKQGFMTAAMRLAINFGLAEIGLKRIWATTTKPNLRAIKLLDRLNFIKVSDLQDNVIEYELRK